MDNVHLGVHIPHPRTDSHWRHWLIRIQWQNDKCLMDLWTHCSWKFSPKELKRLNVHESAHGSGPGRWKRQIHHPEFRKDIAIKIEKLLIIGHRNSMACMAKSPLPYLVFTIHRYIEDPSGTMAHSNPSPAMDILCRHKTQLLDWMYK